MNFLSELGRTLVQREVPGGIDHVMRIQFGPRGTEQTHEKDFGKFWTI